MSSGIDAGRGLGAVRGHARFAGHGVGRGGQARRRRCDRGDGDVDIASAGKTGVHFFENLTIDRVPKEQREKEILLNKDWPFPGEGDIVQQENGPKPQ